MRNTLIVKRLVQALVLGAALATTAMAQSGPGPGAGGNGPGMQRGGNGPCGGGMGMGPGGGRGMGYGMNRGGGRGRAAATGQNVTRGWELMTPQERTEQQNRMRAAKTYDECVAVQTQHRGILEVRAKEKGLTLVVPPANACDNLKARGAIQ
jgi:hypothetical protein